MPATMRRMLCGLRKYWMMMEAATGPQPPCSKQPGSGRERMRAGAASRLVQSGVRPPVRIPSRCQLPARMARAASRPSLPVPGAGAGGGGGAVADINS